MVWRTDLDPALKAKIANFIFSYGVGDSAGGQAPARHPRNASRPAPSARADNSHLLPVREMEATGQLVAGQGQGRRRRIAKAQANMAQLKAEEAAHH